MSLLLEKMKKYLLKRKCAKRLKSSRKKLAEDKERSLQVLIFCVFNLQLVYFLGKKTVFRRGPEP